MPEIRPRKIGYPADRKPGSALQSTSSASTIAAQLRQFDEMYARAGAPVPDGEYAVVVQDATIEYAQKTGNPMLVWRLAFTGATLAGRSIRKYTSLATEGSLAILRRDLKTCGFAPKKVSDLPVLLPKLRTLRLLIAVKMQDGDLRVTFRELLTEEDEDDADAFVGEQDDDEAE